MATSNCCDLCEKSGRDIATSYLRVTRQKIGVGTVREQWTNVECRLCETCFRRIRSLKTRRYLTVALMILWLCIAPILIVVAVSFFPGTENKTARGIIAVVALVVVVGGFIAGPLHIRSHTRRVTKELLGSAAGERLKALTGVDDWGLTKELTVKRKLPQGESAVQL